MARSQREKGKRVEREACQFLGSLGFKARRRSQSDGKLDPDIVFPDHPKWYCEVKGVRGVLPHHKTAQDWVAKADEDARSCGFEFSFVLLKIHGTRNWAMGWTNPYAGTIWMFVPDDMVSVLMSWP